MKKGPVKSEQVVVRVEHLANPECPECGGAGVLDPDDGWCMCRWFETRQPTLEELQQAVAKLQGKG